MNYFIIILVVAIIVSYLIHKSLKKEKNSNNQFKKEDSVDQLSKNIVLNYFQSWGQSLDKRIEALNEVVKFVGIKAEFKQTDNKTGWFYNKDESIKEAEKAKEFRQKLDDCFPKGQVEDEIGAVKELIESYLK